MTWTDLPHPWGLAWQNAEAILEQLNRRQAQALQISADGEVLYPRLLIPTRRDLDLESVLYPCRATTQEAILRAVLVRLASQLPPAHSITVSLLWGGIEGAKLKPLVTFGNPKLSQRERAA